MEENNSIFFKSDATIQYTKRSQVNILQTE